MGIDPQSAQRPAGEEEGRACPTDGSGATDVVAYMNRKKEQFNHIENLYWSIAPSAIQEVIDRVRSNLVELVAEMRAGMSSGDAIPSSKLTS